LHRLIAPVSATIGKGEWDVMGIMRYISGVCLLLVFLAVGGCSFTQPAFVRMADNAGGAFSAAATTLTYVHQGKLSRAYAISSFASYESELSGLDQQLPYAQTRVRP
jgi:hypothetical protein